MAKWVNLKGYVSFAQVYEPDEFQGDRRWKLTWSPYDDKEWAKFESAGLKLEPKEDKEGRKTVQFRRQCSRLFPKDDERTYFTPPEISGAVNVSYVNEDTNEKIYSYHKSSGVKVKVVGEQTFIGNQSVCIVGIQVYPAGEGFGHRLMTINVLDLVGYEDKDGNTKAEPIEQKPVEKKTEKTKESKSLASDMNDEIPFGKGSENDLPW